MVFDATINSGYGREAHFNAPIPRPDDFGPAAPVHEQRAASLVLRWFLGVVDHQEFDWCSAEFQR
jgi:hypothetical protein